MSLEQGEAMFQYDAQVPVTIRTKRLEESPMLKFGQARKLATARNRMIEANRQYYTTVAEIEQATRARQLDKLKKPLVYDDIDLEAYEGEVVDAHEDTEFNTP